MCVRYFFSSNICLGDNVAIKKDAYKKTHGWLKEKPSRILQGPKDREGATEY